MQARHSIGAIAITAALTGCASAPPPTPQLAPFGETKETAINACMPRGSRAYLDRLVCPDGSAPAYHRVGSYGPRNNVVGPRDKDYLQRTLMGAALKPGEVDTHTIDGYEVSCAGKPRMIFVDMYHCQEAATAAAPAGFTIKPAKP